MTIISDNIRAIALLHRINGCKVEDNEGNQYSVVDVKYFNGTVSFIGLKNVDGDVKYATLDCYMEMASVGWLIRPSYVLKTGKNMLKTHKKRLKMCL